jgi:hypothetical protein
MTETLRRLNSRTVLSKFIPASLLGVFACIFQTALLGVSGMIRTQTGTNNRSENGRSVWDDHLVTATSNQVMKFVFRSLRYLLGYTIRMLMRYSVQSSVTYENKLPAHCLRHSCNCVQHVAETFHPIAYHVSGYEP